MSLTLMVGMNGCGKDTITKELIGNHPDMALISGAQILMKNLGIDVDIEIQFPPATTREMYLHLEQTPVEVKAAMRDTVFKDTLLEFKEGKRPGVLLSQLVVARPALSQNQETTFSVEGTEWYPEVFDTFIHISAPVDQIWQRRQTDLRNGARDRGNMAFEDLQIHWSMYQVAWNALANQVGDNSRMLQVENADGHLAESVELIDKFLFADS